MMKMPNKKYLNNDLIGEIDNDNTYQSTFDVSQNSKIEYLIKESKFKEALSLINEALKNEDNYANWNLKALILDNLEKYDESIECYDKALLLNPSDEIKINKANTIYKYAKILFFPKSEYEQALNLINQAIDLIEEIDDVSEFYFLKAEILEATGKLVDAKKSYLIAYGEFEKLKELENQIEYLKNTNDILINITGGYFYDFTPEEGLVVKLECEEDNEHDPDAICVCLDGEKIGYVANSEYTLMKCANSASKIKNKISKDSKAEILFIYLDQYVVAKLI